MTTQPTASPFLEWAVVGLRPVLASVRAYRQKLNRNRLCNRPGLVSDQMDIPAADIDDPVADAVSCGVHSGFSPS